MAIKLLADISIHHRTNVMSGYLVSEHTAKFGAMHELQKEFGIPLVTYQNDLNVIVSNAIAPYTSLIRVHLINLSNEEEAAWL